MLELLNTQGIESIISVLVISGLGLKAMATFFEWGWDKFKTIVLKRDSEARKIDLLDKKIEKCFEKLAEMKELNEKSSAEMGAKVTNLLDSDQIDIRAKIVAAYNTYYEEKGFIYSYTLQSLENQYEIYKSRGGNSYVSNLMDRIRTLPIK